MGRSKLSIEEIKRVIEMDNGYQLLETEYINSHTNMKIRCDKGHSYEATYHNFRHGKRCPDCANNKRKTIEQIRAEIENIGFKLLSTEYINRTTKLKVQCDKGHIYEPTYNDFREGCRCSVCSPSRKKTYEEVKQFIESTGYILLSKKYVNNTTDLKVQCNKRHIYLVSYSAFKNGNRCPDCSLKRKKTYQEVKRQIESVHSYKLLSKDYKNCNTPLKVACEKGHQYEVTYTHFIRGQRCPDCSPYRKKTYEEVKQHIESIGYKLLSEEYKDYKTKLSVVCDKGHTYEVKYTDFKSGRRCPGCAPNKAKTYGEVKQYIESFDYKLLSTEYVDAHSKIQVKCDKGHSYMVTYANFKYGQRCPDCAPNKAKTYEEVKSHIESIGYELLSADYFHIHSKLQMKCDKGHNYEATYDSFKHGSRCPDCANNKRKAYEDVKECIESVDGYTLISTEYKNNNTNLHVKCDKGHTYEVTYANFKKGQRCPKCSLSKGAKRIKDYLLLNNYNFKSEHRFDDCKFKRSLPFDFAVFDTKNELQCLIEYDGEFHFKAIDEYGGKQTLRETKRNDKIKNNYCNRYNLKLIRIPYWKLEETEKILDAVLNDLFSRTIQEE